MVSCTAGGPDLQLYCLRCDLFNPYIRRMDPNSRRSFLKQAATLGGAFSANSLFQQAHAAEFLRAGVVTAGLSPAATAQDEDYWSVIQRAYSVNPNLIN